MTDTDFDDLKPEITLVPIAKLVPFRRRTDTDLRVKRLKEPSSSAELVLVYSTAGGSHPPIAALARTRDQ